MCDDVMMDVLNPNLSPVLCPVNHTCQTSCEYGHIEGV